MSGFFLSELFTGKKVMMHRQGHGVSAGPSVQASADLLHVPGDGVHREAELLGDFAIGCAMGYQCEHFSLAIGE